MKANIGIPEQEIKKTVTFLNTLLADEYVIYTKTRNAHWNVYGPNFFDLHTFFENQYGIIDTMIDDIAERVRSLGHFALGSLKDFISITNMGEENHDFCNPDQIIRTLTNDHETIIHIIRKEITLISDEYKDLGTADFVTGLMEKHEKMVWMLRSHIT